MVWHRSLPPEKDKFFSPGRGKPLTDVPKLRYNAILQENARFLPTSSGGRRDGAGSGNYFIVKEGKEKC